MRYHGPMADREDAVARIRRGAKNLRFSDLCHLLERAGFVLDRTRGSHRIFRHAERPDVPFVNLQSARGGKAKPYQVKQVLNILEAYGLEVK